MMATKEHSGPTCRLVAPLLLLALSVGCAFEVQPVGPGNGGLNGDGLDPGAGDAGLDTMNTPDAGIDATTPDVGLKPVGPDGSTDPVVAEPTCTPGTERSSCPGTSCDPVTLTCTTLKLASRTTCETCFTDSNCAEPNHRCVWMTHYGEPFPDTKTGFCLQITEQKGADCPPPFVVPLLWRESLSGGNAQDYCGIQEKLTSCPAVRAFFGAELCPSGRDDECPQGGLCRGLVTQGQKTEYACTYACTDVPECSTASGKINCAGFCGG
ncbi:MAG: hypothetical protein WBM46_12780 [Polyangiales bacterium]